MRCECFQRLKKTFQNAACYALKLQYNVCTSGFTSNASLWWWDRWDGKPGVGATSAASASSGFPPWWNDEKKHSSASVSLTITDIFSCFINQIHRAAVFLFILRLLLQKTISMSKSGKEHWQKQWLTFAVQDLSQCSEQEQRSIFPSNSLLLFQLLCLFGLLLPLVCSGNSFAYWSHGPVLPPPQPFFQWCVWRAMRSLNTKKGLNVCMWTL